VSLHEPGITHKRQLIRGIGLAGAAILVLNSVIGSGIFALPGTVAAKAGLWSSWLFLLIGMLIITMVLTLAELASYFRDSGGPVLYTTSAFGPLVGFSTGWMLFISRMTAFAANSNVMAIYLGEVWPYVASGTGRYLLITAIICALTWANYVGVKQGVRTMAVITVFKILPIVLLIVLGLQHVTGATLVPGPLPNLDEVGGTTLLLIYAFVGFESATIISGEAKNPKRNLPKAMVQTVVFIAVFYFLIVLVFVSVLPDGGSGGGTLVDVGRELMGTAGVTIITLAAFFSIGGNLSSIMLAVPRLPFAMAEERMLPRWIGHVHEKYATPTNSILVLGGLGLAFALTGTFEKLATASSLTRLISYVLCIGALPVIRNKATPEERAESYRLKGGYTIPLIALVMCLWIGAQSTVNAWEVTGGMLVVGLVLYALAAKRRERANQQSTD
jgi:amino acid transporter